MVSLHSIEDIEDICLVLKGWTMLYLIDQISKVCVPMRIMWQVQVNTISLECLQTKPHIRHTSSFILFSSLYVCWSVWTCLGVMRNIVLSNIQQVQRLPVFAHDGGNRQIHGRL